MILLKLTQVEAEHLHAALTNMAEAGWYFGVRKHCYARTNRLLNRLEDALAPKDRPTPGDATP